MGELISGITTLTLLRFAAPVILAVTFENIYGLVDSLFVANLVGVEALSAVNIVSPSLSITLAIAIMIATGGCAVVSIQMGEGNSQKARENFSFLVLSAFAVSLTLSVLGLFFRKPLLHFMGADSALYPLCEAYAVPIFIIIPFAMIGMMLQLFYAASGVPALGLILSVSGGFSNIILDYVLIKTVDMSIAGAAYATGIGYSIQSVVGIIYFLRNKKGALYFTRPSWDWKMMLSACANGMSEMTSSLAVSITMIAMNVILMKHAGSDGVAAGAIVMASQIILSSLYTGYLQGISPVISFHYGANNTDALKSLFKSALVTLGIMSVITSILVFPLSKPLGNLYAKGVNNVLRLADTGMKIYSLAFLFMGFNLFGSSFFTALNDGRTSAILAVCRTLIFLIIPLLILPEFMGVNGVWLSLPIAEIMSIFLTAWFFAKKKNKYHYA